MTALQPTEIAKFWIQGKVVITNLSQSFYYMSCPGCNKGLKKIIMKDFFVYVDMNQQLHHVQEYMVK
ncbi:hypothetical protein CsatA_015590 [Cannabis sativa]